MTGSSTAERRSVIVGSLLAIAVMAVLTAVMLVLRSHLADATVALVLVVPVVVAVVIGGATAGGVTALAGFLLYDLLFIPPYYKLSVGTPRDWVALVVYVVVVSLVAQVVDRMRRAQQAARSREADTQRLLGLSELLIEDRPLEELLPMIAASVVETFLCEAAVILLPNDGSLGVVAAAGRQLTPAELARIIPARGQPAALTTQADSASTETFVLSVPGHPVGLLGLVGLGEAPTRRTMGLAFANHIAAAIERSAMGEQALRVQVLEQVDRLRGGLVAAVSHDLRTPLTTIKTSAQTLLQVGEAVPAADRNELLELIDDQADRLSRLVSNLLDVSRIETGALTVDLQVLDVGDLVEEAVGSVRPRSSDERVRLVVPEGLPSVKADRMLSLQVIVNLLENALRYAPEGTVVEIAASLADSSGTGGFVEIAVADEGPGISDDQAGLYGLGRPQRPAGAGAGAPAGGSGVGLTIARAFAEAQGGSLAIDKRVPKGARVVVTLLAAG